VSSPIPQKVRLAPWQGAAIGLACGAFLVVLGALGAFHFPDLRLHDWRYRLRGPIAASSRVVLIEVDDATVSAYQAWPLPRSAYALLVDALEQAGASAVGFDLLFIGNNADDPTGDQVLAAETAGKTNIVHAISFQPEDVSLGEGASAGGHDPANLLRHGRPLSRQQIAPARRVSTPYPDLLSAADAVGHTAVVVDPDGVVRRLPLFVRYADWAYPALSIRLVESAARGDSSLPQFELAEDGLRLHWQGRWRSVPTDASGATPIVFAGDRAAFPQDYSMLSVLQQAVKGDTAALARAFRGKLVLVGVTAVGEVAADVGPTPFAEATPLVYIHANAVNAAIAARFLRSPSAGWMAVALLLLGTLIGGTLSRMRLGRSAAVVAGVIAGFAAVDMAVFVRADVDLPSTALLALPLLTWIGVQGYLRRNSDRHEQEYQRELNVARTIQQHMLPEAPPDIPELEVYGVNLPATAVGGDYFDWLPLGDDELVVVLGDVSGHGVPAAILMSHLRASVHAETRPGRSPSEIVQSIHDSLTRASTPGKFATFFLAIISRREPRLRFCNAGHNPPYLMHGGVQDLLGATGLPLAMIDFATYTDEVRDFVPGDVLVIYSDGIPEAPVDHEFYGDERLAAKVAELTGGTRPVAEIATALLDDVRRLAEERLSTDDVTLVVLRRL